MPVIHKGTAKENPINAINNMIIDTNAKENFLFILTTLNNYLICWILNLPFGLYILLYYLPDVMFCNKLKTSIRGVPAFMSMYPNTNSNTNIMNAKPNNVDNPFLMIITYNY